MKLIIRQNGNVMNPELINHVVQTLIEQGYPKDAFSFPSPAFSLAGQHVQSSVMILDLENGVPIAAICESTNLTHPKKDFWDKHAVAYARAVKNENVLFFLVFPSSQSHCQFLERAGDQQWLPIRMENFPSYKDLVKKVSAINQVNLPTTWIQINAQLEKCSKKLAIAKDTQDFKEIALAARTIFEAISRIIHEYLPDKKSSKSPTDLDGNLERFTAEVLAGKSNEELRPMVKKAKAYVNSIVHSNTASFKDAKLCYLSVAYLANILETIVEGDTFKLNKPA